MHSKNIKFLLVQINEAHSSAWPAGLPDQPEPQKCYNDRLDRAIKFSEEDCSRTSVNSCTDNSCTDNSCTESFILRVDESYFFDNTFRAWPDKYYLIDKQYKVIAKSEYGMKKDGLINVDCLDLLNQMLE